MKIPNKYLENFASLLEIGLRTLEPNRHLLTGEEEEFMKFVEKYILSVKQQRKSV